MREDGLERYVRRVRSNWGLLSTTLVEQCRAHLDELTASSASEKWLAALLTEGPATRELHRETGSFMLLAHTEQRGLYRPPHDHGRAWVIYGVQSGELEVGTYVRIPDCSGEKLVRRETNLLRPGEARAYLPGDIHDTRCLSDQALVFRFTERDLKREDQVERKVTRFVQRGDEWFAPTT